MRKIVYDDIYSKIKTDIRDFYMLQVNFKNVIVLYTVCESDDINHWFPIICKWKIKSIKH